MVIFIKIILGSLTILSFSVCGVEDSRENMTKNISKIYIETELSESLEMILLYSKRHHKENIAIGVQLDFQVIGIYTRGDGSFYSANINTKLLQWKSSNSTIATIDQEGVMKAVSVGEVSIEASYGGISSMYTTGIILHEN